MGELSILDRLKIWWNRRDIRKCNHEFKHTFRANIIRDGQCSGGIFCEKCGECYPYEFIFENEKDIHE